MKRDVRRRKGRAIMPIAVLVALIVVFLIIVVIYFLGLPRRRR